MVGQESHKLRVVVRLYYAQPSFFKVYQRAKCNRLNKMENLIGKIIEFKDTSATECDFNKGMKAQIYHVEYDKFDVVKLFLDFSEFKEYNFQFEIAEWRGENNNRLKWSETRFYPSDYKSTEYFMEKDIENEKYFKLL